MRRISVLILLLILVSCSGSVTPRALAADGAEVELIIDYLHHHQVTVIIPDQVSPAPLRDLISDITGSRLHLEGEWTEEDGMHVWLYSAPQLIPGAGVQKAVLWDTTRLADVAAGIGLTAGTNLFLVVNQPQGMLGYDLHVNDQGYELHPVAADEREVWWGFGLQPGGAAPRLSVLLWLRPRLTWVTLSALWIPLLGALALWLLSRRLQYRLFCRIHTIAFWLLLVATMAMANLMRWQAVFSWLLGSPAGFLGQLSWLLVSSITFSWAATLLRLPLHLRLVKQRGQRWTVLRYFEDNWRLLAGLLLLFGAVSLWFGLVDLLSRRGFAAVLLGGLLALTLLLWLAAEFAPYFRFGRQTLPEAQAEELLVELAQRLQLAVPRLYLIPSAFIWQANAFASGMLSPRVHVTRLLWDTLSPRERQFILAHELAHLRRRDPWRLFTLYALPAWLVAGSLVLLEMVDAGWALLVAGVSLLVAALFVMLVALPDRRRSELSADALAVQATGDLAAAASALQRVQRRVSSGGRFRRLLRTHPLLETRLQALHALQVGLPTARN
ncbi:MAG: M48 family metallopeptidase [Bacillota bacterium]|jgi:Zn-dependent protease with chaperone function